MQYRNEVDLGKVFVNLSLGLNIDSCILEKKLGTRVKVPKDSNSKVVRLGLTLQLLESLQLCMHPSNCDALRLA